MEFINPSDSRTISKISRDLGDQYCSLLEDVATVEFGVNPDHSVWIERVGDKPAQIGTMRPSVTRSLIEQVAGYHNLLADESNPVIETRFPGFGGRFTGILPPIADAPSVRIRKHTIKDIDLQDYLDDGCINESQKDLLIDIIESRRNILVSGGTSSGKTTFINAMLKEVSKVHPDHSIIILEDTPELLCNSKNHTKLKSSKNFSMEELVRTSLRWSPDRIILGELRGSEALHLLDAWNSGHPGGICTLHADSALKALPKLESLVTRHPRSPRNIASIVSSAIDFVVHLEKTSKGRRLKQIAKIQTKEPQTPQYIIDRIL